MRQSWWRGPASLVLLVLGSVRLPRATCTTSRGTSRYEASAFFADGPSARPLVRARSRADDSACDRGRRSDELFDTG